MHAPFLTRLCALPPVMLTLTRPQLHPTAPPAASTPPALLPLKSLVFEAGLQQCRKETEEKHPQLKKEDLSPRQLWKNQNKTKQFGESCF